MLTASPLLVESVLHSPGTLLVGDPQVLARLELPADEGIVPTPAGNAVVLRANSSVFVWVAGSSDVASLTATTALDSLERDPTPLGHLDCPSGRLVVGTPAAVAAWGEDIEPATGLAAQARAYTPDRRHRGLVVVARVAPGRHPVLAVTGDEGISGLVIDCNSKVTGQQLLLAG